MIVQRITAIQQIPFFIQNGIFLFFAHALNKQRAQRISGMIVGSVHTLEYLEFLYWLRRTGYNGYLTLDQFPFREDGREAIAESANWLDYLEGLVDRADFDEIELTLAKKDAVAASRLMRRILSSASET